MAGKSRPKTDADNITRLGESPGGGSTGGDSGGGGGSLTGGGRFATPEDRASGPGGRLGPAHTGTDADPDSQQGTSAEATNRSAAGATGGSTLGESTGGPTGGLPGDRTSGLTGGGPVPGAGDEPDEFTTGPNVDANHPSIGHPAGAGMSEGPGGTRESQQRSVKRGDGH